MADRPRNRPANRPPADTAPITGTIDVDSDTAAALALFNTRLSKEAEQERARRRVEKATRAKDQAATRIRTLENDPAATAEARAEATAAYHESLAALEAVKRGDDPTSAPATDAVQPADGDTDDTDDAGDAGDAAATDH